MKHDNPTSRPLYGVGHHPEIILSGDRAYMFYFVQPGVQESKRSSLQVVELKYDPASQTLTADRNAPTLIHLLPPKNVESESKFE